LLDRDMMARPRWLGYAVGLAAVALVTVVLSIVEARFRLPNVSILYLAAVLVTAGSFGSGPAVVASLAAFLAYDWFFVEPRFTFAVASSEEWIALVLFLLTAIVTGQLAAGQRRRSEEAAQREREAVVLYDVVRLLADLDLDCALPAVAQRLLRELGLDAVAIEIADDGQGNVARAAAGDPETLGALPPISHLTAQVLADGAAPTFSQRGHPGRWIRVLPAQPAGQSQAITADRLHLVPVVADGRERGACLLVRPVDSAPFSDADDRLLSAVASQLGVAVERTRLRREATNAEILRGADELKTALLHAVSHNLRTPLASIIAFSGSLRQTDVSWTDAERREFAVAIEQEAQRLNRIVGNLLDLSRVEAGGLRPEKSWYDLGALIDDVIGRMQPILASHPLTVEVPDSLPPVLLDYVEIDQVLSNLLENAARYTPPGAEIRIVVRALADRVEVEVADRGPGISPAALAGLFEPFKRGDVARPPVAGGTGLGLAVSRGLIQAHGGDIRAENRPDGGARFVFTLPLPLAEVRELAAASAEENR
jgi:two-component system sensor histidine kinase KdpD